MPEIHITDAEELQQWLAEGQAVLYDVREVWEYQEGHVDGAILVPLGNVVLNNISVPEDTNIKMVFMCKAGVRSHIACEKLISEGIERDLWNYAGSFLDWQVQGYPVVK